MRPATTDQNVPDTVLGLSADSAQIGDRRIGENGAPRYLRLGEIAAEVQHVAETDAADQD